jgi:hypothetical protein
LTACARLSHWRVSYSKTCSAGREHSLTLTSIGANDCICLCRV